MSRRFATRPLAELVTPPSAPYADIDDLPDDDEGAVPAAVLRDIQMPRRRSA